MESDPEPASPRPTPLHGGTPGLIDVLPMQRGRGWVTDEERARETPCLCRELEARQGGPAEVCFSEGIVGPLSDEQLALYCGAGTETLPLTPEQAARLQQSVDAAQACGPAAADLPQGQRFPEFLACMDRELRARGAAVTLP